VRSAAAAIALFFILKSARAAVVLWMKWRREIVMLEGLSRVRISLRLATTKVESIKQTVIYSVAGEIACIEFFKSPFVTSFDVNESYPSHKIDFSNS
jgi:hypothetical protein